MKGKAFSLNSRAPRCPLCHGFFEKEYVPERRMLVWACHKDRIAINVHDPFVGRWDQALANQDGGKIECPACNADMRFFCTSTGFMKALCPKRSCGAAMTNSEPDRLWAPSSNVVRTVDLGVVN